MTRTVCRLIMGTMMVVGLSTSCVAYTATSASANLDVTVSYSAGATRSISVTVNTAIMNTTLTNWGGLSSSTIVSSNIGSPNWSVASTNLLWVTVNVTTDAKDYFLVYMDHSIEPSFNLLVSMNAAIVNGVVIDDINGVMIGANRYGGLLNFPTMQKMLASNVATTSFGPAIIPLKYCTLWGRTSANAMANDSWWWPLASTINPTSADSTTAIPFISTSSAVIFLPSLAYPKANGVFQGTLRFALVTQ